MMHECKRLLNHSTAAEGLLLARSSTQRTQATSMDAFLVPQPTDTGADADSDATERSGSDDALDEDGDATEHARGDLPGLTTEPPTKKQRRRSTVVSEEQPGDATDRSDYSEDGCDEALPRR